jgi:hypothetical protein
MKDEKMISELKRRIKKYEDRVSIKLEKEQGNELSYTYWGGYDLGEMKGKVTILEEFLDYLEK